MTWNNGTNDSMLVSQITVLAKNQLAPPFLFGGMSTWRSRTVPRGGRSRVPCGAARARRRTACTAARSPSSPLFFLSGRDEVVSRQFSLLFFFFHELLELLDLLAHGERQRTPSVRPQREEGDGGGMTHSGPRTRGRRSKSRLPDERHGEPPQ